MMDEDIDWTWQLGEAVISQQNDVIAAVEAFRDRAYAAGNLKSDERQKVSYDDGVIEIEPADDDVIYVPYYEPAEVVGPLLGRDDLVGAQRMIYVLDLTQPNGMR